MLKNILLLIFINIINLESIEINTIKKRASNKKYKNKKRISKLAKKLKNLKLKNKLKNIKKINSELIKNDQYIKKEINLNNKEINLNDNEKEIIIKSFDNIIELLNKNGKNISNLNFIINPLLQNLIKNNSEYKELNDFIEFIKNEYISKIFEKIIENSKKYSLYIKNSLDKNNFLENEKTYKFEKLTLEFNSEIINGNEIENINNNFKYINIKNIKSDSENLKFEIKNNNEIKFLNKSEILNEFISYSFLPLFIRNIIISKILKNSPNFEKIIEQFIKLMSENNKNKKEYKKNLIEAINNASNSLDLITEEIINELSNEKKENIIKIFEQNNEDNYFELINKSNDFEKLQISFLLNNLSINNIIKSFSEKNENKNNLLKSALLWTGIAVGTVLLAKYSSFTAITRAYTFLGDFAKKSYDRAKNWINEGKPIFETNAGLLSKTWEYTKYFGKKTIDYLNFSPLSFLTKKNDTNPIKKETFTEVAKDFTKSVGYFALPSVLNFGINNLDKKINSNKTTSILFGAPSWALKSLNNFSASSILFNLAKKGYNLFSGKNKNNENGLISLNFENNKNDTTDISYSEIINATEYIIFLNSNNLINKFENINYSEDNNEL